MGSVLSDTRFSTMLMSSLPLSYRPSLQTLTVASKANKTSILPDNLIAFFTEEAEHRVIEDDQNNLAEAALFTNLGRNSRRPAKPTSSNHANHLQDICSNCNRPGHTKPNCWSKGGGKEGQGPRSFNSRPNNRSTPSSRKPNTESTALADEELFAFSCTSNFMNAANDLGANKTKLGAIIDSGASWHFTLDRDHLINYQPIQNKPITTADGRRFDAVGMGDILITLPNGGSMTKAILKKAIYSPGLAFTLISINSLDEAKCQALFSGRKCTIRNHTGQTMAKIHKIKWPLPNFGG
jgi:hypothetical protein